LADQGVLMDSKILSREMMAETVRRLKKQGRKVVFTNGCFDILHAGHVRYLREAKGMGDVLVVGLNSDESVRRLKGEGRPFVPEMDRAELLAALEMVDYITIFDEDTPAELISRLVPDVLVKGGDYRPNDVAGREIVESSGGKVAIVPLFEGRSTTSLIARIKGRSKG